MAGIQYRLYEDRDAESIMELFCRNRFYLGKRTADADDFRYAWRARGGLFGIVGETGEGRIVSYLAVYPTGDRIVCQPHQVVMGGLLVDRDYRLQLYSMPEMYRLMLLEIRKHYPEITTLVSEVDDYRRQSLLIQRYLGSVMLNGTVPCEPHIYIFYNFMPGFTRLFDPSSEILSTPMMSMLCRADKKRAVVPDPVRNGLFVENTFQLPYGKACLTCHIPSGLTTSIAVQDHWAFGLEDSLDTAFFRFMGPAGRATAVFYGESGILLTENITENWSRHLPEGTRKVYIRIEGIGDSFWFDPVTMQRAQQPKRACINLENSVFDPDTGLFSVGDRFSVAWPFADMPYRVGMLQPERFPAMETVCRENGCITARLSEHGTEMLRTYTEENDRLIRIETRYSAAAPHPMFLIHIRKPGMRCIFGPDEPETGEILLDTGRDLDFASPEIPYVLLGSRKDELRTVRAIQMIFEDEVYLLRFSRPVDAFLQFDCLCMFPSDGADGQADLPEILIERLEKA
ncbi:MAG: hypothetical protein IJ242_00650 [Clostridia bacterium]|nr:hypothetical protein [Clostridia bacterium]